MLLFAVVLSLAQGPSKSSLSSKQAALLKLCSGGTGAANKPERGGARQHRRPVLARSPHRWHKGNKDVTGCSCRCAQPESNLIPKRPSIFSEPLTKSDYLVPPDETGT